jgi:uncharacterized protein with PIN domain
MYDWEIKRCHNCRVEVDAATAATGSVPFRMGKRTVQATVYYCEACSRVERSYADGETAAPVQAMSAEHDCKQDF